MAQQHHGVETGIQKIEKEIREAEALLKKPGAFLRLSASKLRPYEAVFPGDWVTFQSVGVGKAAFELMWRRGGLSQISPRRWILKVGVALASGESAETATAPRCSESTPEGSPLESRPSSSSLFP